MLAMLIAVAAVLLLSAVAAIAMVVALLWQSAPVVVGVALGELYARHREEVLIHHLLVHEAIGYGGGE